MKIIIPYLCLTTGFFSIISSSLPIPKEHYILSAIQQIVPTSTGIGAGVGGGIATGLGPGGTAAGYVLGGAAGAAAGVVSGTVAGALQKWTGSACSSKWRMLSTSKVTLGFSGSLLLGAPLAPAGVAAGTTAVVDGLIRDMDPYAGLCDRPD